MFVARDENMELSFKQKLVIGIVGVLIIVGAGVYIYMANKEEEEYNFNDFYANTEPDKKKENTIMVHITGEVKIAGIIELPEESRIADAIEQAGGVTEEADLDQVNLAFVLSDGQKIYIPNKKEREANEGKVYITAESGNNVIIKDKVEGGKKQKVNINEAKQEDLEELPGIGPSIAKKIIEYREQNGKFTSIDELQEVKGIGEAKFENIKEYITVK